MSIAALPVEPAAHFPALSRLVAAAETVSSALGTAVPLAALLWLNCVVWEQFRRKDALLRSDHSLPFLPKKSLYT